MKQPDEIFAYMTCHLLQGIEHHLLSSQGHFAILWSHLPFRCLSSPDENHAFFLPSGQLFCDAMRHNCALSQISAQFMAQNLQEIALLRMNEKMISREKPAPESSLCRLAPGKKIF